LCEVAGVIQVTRLNGTQFFVNAELIQIVESTPDTIISLTTNVKVIVHETAAEVVDRIIEYRKKVYSSPLIYSASNSVSGE
jgi:flagellar protein FlbD